MSKINLAEIKSELYPHLQAQGFDNATIAQVTNTLTVNGNNNITFQNVENSPITIQLGSGQSIDIAKLILEITRKFPASKIPKWLGQQWRQTSPFIGRKQEIQDIEDILGQQQALVLVNGIGGEGKTVLANAIMKQEPCLYEHLIWTNCQNAPDENENVLRSALLYNSYQLHLDLGIVEDLKETNNENEKWGILMNAFKKLNGKVLWVIDNARQDDFKAIRDLPQNCKILLTSREKIGNLKTYTLNELNEVDALKLFKTYYTQKDDDEILKQICETVGRHALSIELLAHTLNNLYDKDAAYLLEQLQENGLNIKRKIAVWTDYEAKETYLNDCLLLAFTLGNIALQIEFHPLLQLFTLLPYQTTPFFLLKYLQQIEDETAADDLRSYIRTLTKLGWIKQENTNAIKPNQKGWMMHPVIQDCIGQQLLVEQEMKENCIYFLREITWNLYKENRINAQVYKPYLECITIKSKVESENKALLYDLLANLNQAIGYHNIAIIQKQKAVSILEKKLPANHINLADIYNNIGLTYNYLTDHENALQYQKKSLAIYERNLFTNPINLASVYNNISLTYQGLVNYDKALKYQKKSLAIYEIILPLNHPNLATIYMNIANTYNYLTNYDNALKYQKKSLAIYEIILPLNHPNLATIYINIANTYHYLTTYDKALKYQKKSLAIYEIILPLNHPNLAITYNNIGLTHRKLQ